MYLVFKPWVSQYIIIHLNLEPACAR